MENSKKPKSSTKEATAAPAATTSQDEKRSPARTLRIEDCSASIWAREATVQGKPKTFYTVTLERSYKDRDGAWKYTRSLDPESLGKIMTLCQQASEVIEELRQA
jgi:hypothetical protein